MLRIIKQGNDLFRAEEVFIEDNEEVTAYSVENLDLEGLRKFVEGRVDEDSLSTGLQLVSFTRFPATFDSRGKLMGVIEANA